LHKKLHQILALAGHLSDEHDANIRVGPPYGAALMPGSLDDHIEAHRQSICRRNLKTGARGRKIPDSTIKLGRLVAENDLGGLQNALAENGSFFWHGPDA
jgi:hypothetical protein